MLWAGLSLSPSFFPVPRRVFPPQDTPQAGLLHLYVAGRQHQHHEWRQLPRHQDGRPP